MYDSSIKAFSKHGARILLLSRLLLYPGNVGLRDGVPGLHVLVHARSEAVLLAFGERRAGLGDAAFEAVLIEFL